MKRDINTVELFTRLGKEVPGIRVKWSSYLSTDMNNVIHAEGIVEGNSLYFPDRNGARAYGTRKIFKDLQAAEYLQKYSVIRRVSGCSLFLETFI